MFLEELDEEATTLMMRSAPYSEMAHDSYLVIEQLRRLVDTSPLQVGRVFLSIMKESSPTYPKEDIEAILSALYRGGGESRKMANAIFDQYLKQGVGFTTELQARLRREKPSSS